MSRVVSVELIVGMEVHVELATRTKMFSRAGNPAHPGYFDAEPNTLIDETVLALPGALPVLNREAIELAMLVGLALGCRIARRTRWDRKSYMYADLPKGYQISQYDLPLCADGAVDVRPESERGTIDLERPLRRVRIERAHLEEDAGKLLHEAPGGGRIDFSIVDLNRAGTPLLEIVTRPDIRSADEAVGFARRLRQTCRYLGVSECVMQRGQMRFEPNINTVLTLDDGRSVRTPIVEVKNLNSFRAVRGAIEHELAEQPRRWERDGIEQGPGAKSTRRWDEARGVTVPQREKEDAHDYRYFPDPDLIPIVIDEEWLEAIRKTLPELPAERKRRFIEAMGLPECDAEVLTSAKELADYFEEAAQGYANAKKLGNWIMTELMREFKGEIGEDIAACKVRPQGLADLLTLIDKGSISGKIAKTVFAEMLATGKNPEEIVTEKGLVQMSDEGDLVKVVRDILAKNPEQVAQFREGKTKVMGFFVGQLMKQTQGRANPGLANELFSKELGKM